MWLKTKCAYISKVGLSISKKVSRGDYVFLFVESLNVKTRTKRGFHVRLWEGDSVISIYFDSQLLGHATAASLKEVVCYIFVVEEKDS